jgi:hypothetical protein
MPASVARPPARVLDVGEASLAKCVPEKLCPLSACHRRDEPRRHQAIDLRSFFRSTANIRNPGPSSGHYLEAEDGQRHRVAARARPHVEGKAPRAGRKQLPDPPHRTSTLRASQRAAIADGDGLIDDAHAELLDLRQDELAVDFERSDVALDAVQPRHFTGSVVVLSHRRPSQVHRTRRRRQTRCAERWVGQGPYEEVPPSSSNKLDSRSLPTTRRIARMTIRFDGLVGETACQVSSRR